jgi:UDPglucose 6-dehydrogenase
VKVAFVGGAGRLGMAFALWSAECGHEVIVSDVDRAALDRLREGKVNTLEPGLIELAAAHKDNLILTTDNGEAAHLADLVCIVVNTPSTPTGAFSSRHVLTAARELVVGLHNGYKVVNIVSTVMPGEVRQVGRLLERISGLVLGVDFGLVHCPEFIRQGSIIADFNRPAFVVVGEYDRQSGDVAELYFDSVTRNTPALYRMSLESAEIAKIGLNAVVVAKMTLANELAWLCQGIPGADARDVLDAIGADDRIGHSYFGAGTWPGGPCFPRDTKALAAAGRQAGMGTFVIAEVGRAADRELHRLADFCQRLMLDYPRVGVLGLAYKPGVNLREESQGTALIDALAHLGVIDAHDPVLCRGDLPAFVARHDLLVLMTCWPEYEALQEMDLSGKCVVDMWGYLDGIECCEYIRFGKGP